MNVSAVHKTIGNPYPDQTPVQLLTRNYRLGDFPWGPTFAGVTLDFPQFLFGLPNIQSALSTFLYFRAGLKIEFRINSTPFHSGALQISWLPCYTGPDPGLYSASGNHPVVLSASTQGAATIEIPYVNPATYLRWKTCPNSAIARVYVHNLVPLVTSSPDTTDTVPVSVFASFTNPEVAGYVHPTTTPLFKPVIRKIGRSESSMTPLPNIEATAKSSSKLETAAEGVFAMVRPVLKTIDTIAAPVMDVFKMFSVLDKPDTVQLTTSTYPELSSDFVHGDGQAHSRTVSVKPGAMLSMSPSLFPGETSATNVGALAQIPMLHYTAPFNLLNTVISLPVFPRFLQNSEFQPDYLMFISDSFNYWRGSIRYYLHFVTNCFTTGRFRISVNYSPYSDDTALSGDQVSRIVDVKGDTMTEISIPYCWDRHWRQVSDITETLPVLTIEAITPIIGQSIVTDPLITLVVWRSAGQDLEFSQLIDAVPPVFSTGRLTTGISECSIRERFEQAFPPILEGTVLAQERGFIAPEVITDLGSCLKRFVGNGNFLTSPTQDDSTPTEFGDGGQALNKPFLRFRQMFYFWRGSRRCKSFATSQQAITVRPTPAGVPKSGNGVYLTDPSINPMLGVTIPWYSTLPYYPCDPTDAAIADLGGQAPQDLTIAAGTPDGFWIAAGDDFVYCFLRAPPPYAHSVSRTRPLPKVVSSKTAHLSSTKPPNPRVSSADSD